MPKPPRTLAFITASTDHGTMIVNRFDQHIVGPNMAYGAGFQLLDKAAYDPDEVALLLNMLDLRRKYYGDGVVAVDCGANLGVHTVEWAKHMTGWGVVLAFEAQERIYYALAGNVAINNCFNARVINAAVTSQPGTMKIPKPDYLTTRSFGSLELKKRENTEFIGQPIDYSEDKMVEVRAVNLDLVQFPAPRSAKDRCLRDGALCLGRRCQMHRRQTSNPSCRSVEDRHDRTARPTRKLGLYGRSERNELSRLSQKRPLPGKHQDRSSGNDLDRNRFKVHRLALRHFDGA